MSLADPCFPPLLTGHPVNPPGDPFKHACRGAARRDLGAADVVWSRGSTRADLAIVLEPEVPLECALQMAPLMMVAAGDCLAALCPPPVAVQYRWPLDILLSGLPIGVVRIAAPRGPLDQAPAWLVVGVKLSIAGKRKGDRQREPQTVPIGEIVGSQISRTDVLQSLAAHFLTWLDIWHDEGFRPVHDHWLFRAVGREAPVRIVQGAASVEGLVLGLDEAANLMIKPGTEPVRGLPFLPHVELLEGMLEA
jgi:biotin-(acetyl-CoA carboxylase) ligase